MIKNKLTKLFASFTAAGVIGNMSQCLDGCNSCLYSGIGFIYEKILVNIETFLVNTETILVSTHVNNAVQQIQKIDDLLYAKGMEIDPKELNYKQIYSSGQVVSDSAGNYIAIMPKNDGEFDISRILFNNLNGDRYQLHPSLLPQFENALIKCMKRNEVKKGYQFFGCSLSRAVVQRFAFNAHVDGELHFVVQKVIIANAIDEFVEKVEEQIGRLHHEIELCLDYKAELGRGERKREKRYRVLQGIYQGCEFTLQLSPFVHEFFRYFRTITIKRYADGQHRSAHSEGWAIVSHRSSNDGYCVSTTIGPMPYSIFVINIEFESDNIIVPAFYAHYKQTIKEMIIYLNKYFTGKNLLLDNLDILGKKYTFVANDSTFLFLMHGSHGLLKFCLTTGSDLRMQISIHEPNTGIVESIDELVEVLSSKVRELGTNFKLASLQYVQNHFQGCHFCDLSFPGKHCFMVKLDQATGEILRDIANTAGTLRIGGEIVRIKSW